MLRNNIQIITSWKRWCKFYPQTTEQLGKFYCDSTDRPAKSVYSMFAQIKIGSQGLHVATAISLIIFPALKEKFKGGCPSINTARYHA